MPQFLLVTLVKTKARANKTFIVQASLKIITYDCQNIFIVKTKGIFQKDRKSNILKIISDDLK